MVPTVLTGAIGLAFVLTFYGLVRSLQVVGASGDPSQKAKVLADSMALSMNALHYASFAAVATIGVLLALTWRYRRTPPKQQATSERS